MHRRKTAESALIESAERSRAIIDALEEGIVLHEADGTISGCNAGACRILGLTEEQILGRTIRTIGGRGWRALRENGTPFEPESHPAAITLLTGQPCSHVVMGVERRDGTRVWISVNSRPLRRPGGEEPFAVAVSFSDITRHKAAEEELRRRVAQQSALADLGRHALEGTEIEVLMDEAVRRVGAVLGVELCKIVDSGPSGLRLRAGLGWTSDEAGRLKPVRLTGGEAPREWLGGIAAPIPGRERPWGVLSAASRAGRDFRPDDLEFLQAVANVLAVALEQADLRQKISKSSYEWRITFDAMPHPVLLLELDGRIVRLNEAARELAGLSFIEILRRTAGTIRDAEPWRTIASLLRHEEEATAQVRDEQGRTWDLSLSPVISPDGQPGVVVVARDLTDLVRLQESLRRSETMSAMGVLVAGVAHEVRNPLFGISATLAAFTTRFKRRTEYRRYVEVLQGEVDRLNALMQDLLEYGKPLRLVLEPGHAEEVMQAAVTACAQLAEQAEVEIAVAIETADARERGNGLPALVMDRKRMTQVFQNLLANAIQHSPRGGRVALRAEPAADEPAGVLFRVEDGGAGFQPDDLPHLFEPFFTRRRGGTGLGLSIVQRIVDQHQGEITAANRPEGGAAVTVRLPLKPSLV